MNGGGHHKFILAANGDESARSIEGSAQAGQSLLKRGLEVALAAHIARQPPQLAAQFAFVPVQETIQKFAGQVVGRVGEDGQDGDEGDFAGGSAALLGEGGVQAGQADNSQAGDREVV